MKRLPTELEPNGEIDANDPTAREIKVEHNMKTGEKRLTFSKPTQQITLTAAQARALAQCLELGRD